MGNRIISAQYKLGGDSVLSTVGEDRRGVINEIVQFPTGHLSNLHSGSLKSDLQVSSDYAVQTSKWLSRSESKSLKSPVTI